MDELGDLALLRLLAVLATYRQDGTVLLSPVWHEWRDGGFGVVTGSRDVKAAHLRRYSRASIVVCAHSRPAAESSSAAAPNSSPQEPRTQSSESHLATSALRPEPHRPAAPAATPFASNRVTCCLGFRRRTLLTACPFVRTHAGHRSSIPARSRRLALTITKPRVTAGRRAVIVGLSRRQRAIRHGCPRPDGVRGPNIYTGHTVSRTPGHAADGARAA
jgi:hypothetical protein